MNAADWEQVQRHFEALCDLEPEQQRQQLDQLSLPDELRHEVEQLLAFDEATGLERLEAEVDQVSRDLEGEDIVGQEVGTYRLIKPLGEGGMGEVYLAERSDGRFEAKVAVKFLAVGGARGRRLFDRERHILARLNHPSIARLIDAGEHPRLGAYLVMEFVAGEPIHELVRRRGIGAVRICRWLASAAEAVAYAHQNLVLHRDLKPDHLIVSDDNQLKVLDFGVATLMGRGSGQADLTEHASFTPRYAAPEQILNQPTTTRTDVYGLGLVMFELLGDGSSPFGESATELAESKLADRRSRLARRPDLNPRQMKDVQAILSRCLARNPEQRYASAGELAADLRAVIADEPTSARAPGWPEWCRRWLSRHRLAGAAILIALVAIVGGTGFSAWFAHRAQVERNAAVQEAAKSREITAFLESIFSTATPGIEQGPDMPVRELLDRGHQRIDEELGDQPEIAAYLELAIARSYMFLGMNDQALALAEATRVGESDSTRYERALLAARIDNMKGHYDQAVERLSPLNLQVIPPNRQAYALIQLATAEVNRGNLSEAAAAARKAVEAADETPEGLDMSASAQSMLGVVAYNRSDYDSAHEAFTRVYDIQKERHGESHGKVGLALQNLAGVTYVQNDLDASLDYYQRALGILQGHFGVENRSVAMVVRSMGVTYWRMGDAVNAEQSLRRALAIYEDWIGRDYSVWREALAQLVELLVVLDRDDDAVEWLSQVMPLDSRDWQSEQTTACRLQRVAIALTLDAGASLAFCQDDPINSEHSRALVHFLKARRLRAVGDVEYVGEVGEARRLLAGVQPSDPLLQQALDRL